MIDLTDYVKKDELSSLVDLSNYYTKEETYSKDEIDTQISGLIGADLKDYLKKTEAEAEYAKLTALDDYVTKKARS